ncbi:MAG: hypothetical protein Q9187_006550 [Circinaria calcarea]
MADPLSIAGLVFTCGSIVNALVSVYETLKDGPAALKELLARTTALELLLKRLQAFEQQLNSDRKAFLTAFFDSSKCQETITALAALVKQTKPAKESFHQDLKGRVQWLLKKSDAEDLVAKLLKQQMDIVTAINMISRSVERDPPRAISHVSDDSSESIQDILQIVARNQPVKAFEEAPVPQLERRPVWFGQRHDTEELRLNRQYVRDRARFADAAYAGDWPTVLSSVRTYSGIYGQPWVNCTRMSSSPDNELSGFTALHHAAYHGAPVEVVRQLVAMGAWRTARAVRVPRQDMTPLDIARSAGFDHLYEVLSPVLRHTLASRTIYGLERKLYELIRHNEAVESRLAGLRLPDLSVLLELEAMEMWFPVTALSKSV